MCVGEVARRCGEAGRKRTLVNRRRPVPNVLSSSHRCGDHNVTSCSPKRTASKDPSMDKAMLVHGRLLYEPT
jgi:hypothetical protein